MIKMQEEKFQEELKDVLEMLDIFAEINGETFEIKNISTFQECGILTNNKGLVVTLNDGSEFQIKIIKSKGE